MSPSTQLRIGDRTIGDGQPIFFIAEIGINHNGSLDLARELIDLAVKSGCDAVKFQKRTPEKCVPQDQWNLERDTPWGRVTYIDYRRRIEFGESEYQEIDRVCRERGIMWFASCWDEESVDFIDHFSPPAYKIASACLTDDALLRHTRAKGRPVLLSTGMSTNEQIEHAIEVLGRQDLGILHACSAYPAYANELNLRVIPVLRERFGIPIGYSGHETGLATTIAAVALGATFVERHITLARELWGTDQAASLGPSGLQRLVRDIRLVESAFGDGVKRIEERELPVMMKLRRVSS